jgi:hypothetical protein
MLWYSDFYTIFLQLPYIILEVHPYYDPGPNFSFHTPANYIPSAPAPVALILPPIYHAAPPVYHVPTTA